ncbi:DeoR/GlpR family DNA-binding transcription regulator [Paucibacter sp. APW11]|uniref:DeoR/GlpR family DNA-binding transcription regulator n=1 Tax=Roseateles aquae TaxID=3077235 RepID=A0ABU3PEW9_9BURK|nr:DeoR/GlpR family DNA-binding transcription regulator [Paucibacter sp. APW11]MDT9001135.1 DeoR/GlpR family DNA-binding transcription regulator [Paucibacter sp. APW11]
MWLHERHKKIIALLNERQRLSTEMFAAELRVSRETVRRDLIELEQSGQLSRVHGGAIPNQAPAEPSYVERSRLFQAEKLAIAKRAVQLVTRGQCCFIDAGSTTHALAHELAKCEQLQVITNSVDVAAALSRNASLEVLLLGGRLESDVPATYGEQTIAEIKRFQVDLALISPVAISADGGAMDYAWHEACVARAMLAQAKTRVLMADANKLGVQSRVQICSTQAIDVLVTDGRAEPAQLAELRAGGVGEILQAAP